MDISANKMWDHRSSDTIFIYKIGKIVGHEFIVLTISEHPNTIIVVIYLQM